MKKNYGQLVLLALLIFITSEPHAAIHKCTIKGKISYSDKPCPDDINNNSRAIKQANRQPQLTERMLYKPNDALLTYDSRSELEWLDLTETIGQTYKEVINSKYLRSMGFRYATKKEVLDFFFAAETKEISTNHSSENLKAAEKILKLLGCTSYIVQPQFTCGDNSKNYFHMAMFVHDYSRINAKIGQSSVEIMNNKGAINTFDTDIPHKQFRSRKASYLVRATNKDTRIVNNVIRAREPAKKINTKKTGSSLYEVFKEMEEDDFDPKHASEMTKKWLDIVDRTNKKNNKTMPFAIKNGDVAQVKSLLSQGADIHKEDKKGRNTLLSVARSGQYKIMQAFIDHGANVNYRNKFGHTSLSQAIKKNHTNIVELLLKNGANPEIPGSKDIPILITAIDNNNLEIVKLLLNAGADPNYIQETRKGPSYNPIIRASSGKNDDIRILQALLEAGGKADIIDRKTTVLTYSLDGKHNNKIKYLLENGANPNAIGNYDNPVAFSKGIYHTETLSILLNHGFDPNTKDKNGFNALMRISKGVNMSDKIKLLLDAGTDITYRTPEGTNVIDIINEHIKKYESNTAPIVIERLKVLEEQKTLIKSYM